MTTEQWGELLRHLGGEAPITPIMLPIRVDSIAIGVMASCTRLHPHLILLPPTQHLSLPKNLENSHPSVKPSLILGPSFSSSSRSSHSSSHSSSSRSSSSCCAPHRHRGTTLPRKPPPKWDQPGPNEDVVAGGGGGHPRVAVRFTACDAALSCSVTEVSF